MLDWNGNGKIDPIDIGVSIASEKDTEAEESKVENKKSNAGCLTSIISVVSLIAVVIFFVF